MSVNGESNRDPFRVGVPVVDLVTGILSFSGILLAVQERHRTGRRQLVDLTLLDTALSMLHPHSAAWLADGKIPSRTGSAHPTIARYDTFHTRNGLFFVSAANVSALRAVLADLISEWEPEELRRGLLKVGVAASPVHAVAQALTSQQALYRDMLVNHGGYRGVGIPINLAQSPEAVRLPPAAKGADTRKVLKDAGYRPDEIASLLEVGVVREPGRSTATAEDWQGR